MSYYNLEQALEVFKKKLPEPMLPFDLPQLAALCRQNVLTLLFPYHLYISKPCWHDEDNGRPIYAPGDTHRFNGYLAHDHLISLIDGYTDTLSLSDGAKLASESDILLFDRYQHHPADADPKPFTVTTKSIRIVESEVQNYITLQYFDDLTTPEQQRIAELENELAALKEQLSQQANTPADADPLQGIAKYNADKAYIITTGKALASYLWSMDNTQAIRTGDMVQQVRQVMHNIDPSMLPDDKTLRVWLSSIAPDYAKKGGKPSNHAPNEIPLIMKK